LAASTFEWAKIIIGQELVPSTQSNESIVYHVSLLRLEIQDEENISFKESMDPIYLYQLSDDCIDQRGHPNDPIH